MSEWRQVIISHNIDLENLLSNAARHKKTIGFTPFTKVLKSNLLDFKNHELDHIKKEFSDKDNSSDIDINLLMEKLATVKLYDISNIIMAIKNFNIKE